ncbi:MAG: helix-turn-helix domain-containing protein [Alphaproteobacteria bacterium]|nr:helix-turn-helix domain-containing protein [Alphaproteobacteria bacterium]
MERAPIERALSILEVLAHGGTLALQRIAADAKLPKSTTVRLLLVLAESGYVRRVSRSAGYQATTRTLRLARTSSTADLIADAATAPMQAFTREFLWPLFLMTREGSQMRSLLNTADLSPHAVDPTAVGYRSPMLLSAVGRAYIAFCPPAERAELIAALRVSKRPTDRLARDAAALARMLSDVRRKGYASTDEALRQLTSKVPPQWRDARRRARGLAVPIVNGRSVLATVSMRYLPKALSEDEAARAFLKPLRRLADDIAAAHVTLRDER